MTAAKEVSFRLGADASAHQDGLVSWSDAEGDHRERFDLVIGADGISSGIRRGIWGGTSQLRYAGYSAWRGITREPIDVNGEAGETWGRGERFGVAPLSDGRIYWFAVANLPEKTRFPNEHEEVQRRFGHWHHPIREIIAKTASHDVFRHDICDLAAPVACFVRGRVILLGDAAHAMTPDLGQGGNQAMEDAATIALLLAPLAAATDPDDSQLMPILQRYDAMRRPRTQAIARQARALGRLSQVQGRPGVWARNLLLLLVPPCSWDGAY